MYAPFFGSRRPERTAQTAVREVNWEDYTDEEAILREMHLFQGEVRL